MSIDDMYLEEIRLSRALARALQDETIYLHKEALDAYYALLHHYELEIEEGVQ